METQKVKTEILYKVGTIVEMENKHYEVIYSRKLIPFLGESEGFMVELKEVNNEQ